MTDLPPELREELDAEIEGLHDLFALADLDRLHASRCRALDPGPLRVLVDPADIAWTDPEAALSNLVVLALYDEVLRCLETGTRNVGAELALHVHRNVTYRGTLIAGLTQP